MTLLRKLIKSSAFRTLETAINIGVGFLMLPLLMHHLGEEIYGIWVLVGSITASFYLFDLGFASAVTRFIAASLTRGDRAEAQHVSSTAFVLYCALALLITFATIITASLAPNITSSGDHTALTQSLIIITGLSLALEFPFKAYAGIISYHVRYDLMSAVRISVKLATTIATIAALLIGKGIIEVALIGLAGSLISNLAFRYFSHRLEPDVHVKISRFRRAHLKDLFNFSTWTFLIDVSRLLQERAPLWSIGFFLGPQLLAVFYVGQRLVEYIFQFLYRAVSMYTPILTREHVNNNIHGFTSKLIIFTKLNVILACTSMVGFITLGEPLIKLWMGNNFDYRTAYLSGLFLLAGKMLLFITMPTNSAFLSRQKPRVMSFVSMAETSFLGVLLIVVPTLFDTSLISIAFSVMASYALTRLILVPALICKELKLSIGKIIFLWGRPLLVSCVGYYFISSLYSNVQTEIPQITAVLVCATFYGFYVLLTLPFLLSALEHTQLARVLPERWMLLFNWPTLFAKHGET